MRKTYVIKTSYNEVAENWGFEFLGIQNRLLPLYVRCNSKGETKWEYIYEIDELIEKNNVVIVK